MRAILFFLFFLFLLVMSIVPAFADEGDANTRYHDAYVLEVVEGKTAEAAKAYLLLIDDESAPKRLRLESRFRFAVCAVLLGRSDEARAHLDELLAIADLPESVRTRAETYRKSTTGIGLGTELDKKLRELVFGLARVDPSSIPPEYREFEVIGTQAVSFLRKLLEHQDANLRTHAFRLLVRIQAPDVVDLWEPQMFGRGPHSHQLILSELNAYFETYPEAKNALEARVLALGKPAVEAMGRIPHWQAATPGFLKAFVDAGGNKANAVRWAAMTKTPEANALLLELVNDKDEKTRKRIIQGLVQVGYDGPDAEKLFPPILDAAIAEGGTPNSFTVKLHAWARRVSADTLLNALERVATEDARVSIFDGSNRHWSTLSSGLLRHELTPEQYQRYFTVFRKWTTQVQMQQRAVERLRSEVRPHLVKAPKELAESLVSWIFAASRKPDQRWTDVFEPANHPRHVSLIALATPIAPVEQRWSLLRVLPVYHWGHRIDAAAKREQIELTLRLLPVVSDSQLDSALKQVSHAATSLDEDAQRSILQRLHVQGSKANPRRRARFLKAEFIGQGDVDYFLRMGMQFAESQWAEQTEDVKRDVLGWVVSRMQSPQTMPEAKEPLRAFLRRHREDLSAYLVGRIGQSDERILAYEDWLPYARWDAMTYTANDPQSLSVARIPRERRDALAKTLVEKYPLSESIIKFATYRTSDEAQTMYADQFLALEDKQLREFTIEQLANSGKPASLDAIERTLATMLAEPEPQWNVAKKLLKTLARERPTPKLLAATQRFLESGDKHAVVAGIDTAGDLGSETLLSALGELLHSMDSEIRRNAKTTMDEIDALVRVRGPK